MALTPVPDPVDEPTEPAAEETPDAASTQLRLPTFEGHKFHTFGLNFAGLLELDPSDPSDAALIRKLRLGETVAFTIVGKVTGRKHSLKQDREGFSRNVASAILTVDRFLNVETGKAAGRLVDENAASE